MTLLVGRSLALPVTSDKASSVAATFWCELTGSKAKTELKDLSSQWAYDGIYLFVRHEGGFVLVAADDASRPILGYSTTSTIDPANLPPALSEWLGQYQVQIEAARSRNAKATPADATEWERLASGKTQPLAKDGVGPLLTTQWDQKEPYNELCPQGAVTGCAATAQAQMMKFWNYPAFGCGAHSYVSPNYGTQSADFAHTVFDWDKMPNRPTVYSPADQRNAVATLMYLCGVALEMNYNTAEGGGSAAAGLAGMPGVHSIDNSLKDYFHYSNDMYVISKNQGYTDATWRAALIEELDRRHPIIYSGAAMQGGHGFVCDGYDARQYMHFNFGWSGVGDGYYPVDSISPGVGGVGGNVTYTFNLLNQALIGAVPDYALRVSDTLFSFSSIGGTDSVAISIDETNDSPLSVSCDAPWLTVGEVNFDRSGWLTFSAAAFDGDLERNCHIIVRQGSATTQIKVVQTNYSPDEMCPLTVVMESTREGGWQGGAHLTLESKSGYLFGEARLTGGERDSVTIMVIPKDVLSVWHSGGGTDRYINYYVKNQHNETVISAVYAYSTGGTDLIPWPCGHVAVEPVAQTAKATVYPNPVSDILNVSCSELQQIELYDIGGHCIVISTSNKLDMKGISNGTYFLKIVTEKGAEVRRIVKR